MPARARHARPNRVRGAHAHKAALPGTLLTVGGVALGSLAVLPATTAVTSSSAAAAGERTVVTLGQRGADQPSLAPLGRTGGADVSPGAVPAIAVAPAAGDAPVAPAAGGATAAAAPIAPATAVPSPAVPAAVPGAAPAAAPVAAPAAAQPLTAGPTVAAPIGKAVRPGDGRLTSRFGPRWGRLHAGIDLAAGTGSPVRAVLPGTVQTAETQGGYGRVVRLLHADGTVTVYGHLSELLVVAGQQVGAGDQLGREGSSGHSTGPHLHFEVRVDDVPIDPIPWLAARGIAV